MAESQAESETRFGANAWLVDEMYDQYRADPSSVSESWRDFFPDEPGGSGPEPRAEKESVQTDTASEPPPPERPAPKAKEPKKEAKAEPKAEPKAKAKAEAGGDGDKPEPIR